MQASRTCDRGVLACTVASLASLPWTLGAHAFTDAEAAGSGCLTQPARVCGFSGSLHTGTKSACKGYFD